MPKKKFDVIELNKSEERIKIRKADILYPLFLMYKNRREMNYGK